jgi:hypothetical protein
MSKVKVVSGADDPEHQYAPTWTEPETFLFDSLNKQFHWRMFFFQLAIHVFLPLMIFSPNFAAHGFHLTKISVWVNIVDPLLLYIMILSFSFSSSADRQMLGFSVLIPILLFMVHKTTVALKYATLSPTEYKRFMVCTDTKQILHFRQQMQLFSGWLNLDSSLVIHELSLASARIGVKINHIFLIIDNNQQDQTSYSQLIHWKALFHDSSREDIESLDIPKEFSQLPDGNYVVSVFDLCKAVIRHAHNHTTMKNLRKVTYVCTVLLIAINLLPTLINYGQITSKTLIVCYLVTSTLEIAFYAPVFFSFQVVALFDVMRLRKMMKGLHTMIRLTDIMMHHTIILDPEIVIDNEDSDARHRIQSFLSICTQSQVQSFPGPVDKGDFYELEKLENEEELEPVGLMESTSFKENTVLHNESLMPRINLYHSQNATAWLYARLTIQNFGERFRFRTDVYTGLIFMNKCCLPRMK